MTPDQRKQLEMIGKKLNPAMRIGYKDELATWIVGKANLELGGSGVIKVEFVKIPNQKVKELVVQLAEATGSECLAVNGSSAVLFRKPVNKSLEQVLLMHTKLLG
jgi:RNA-binding protein YhbY